MSVLDQVQVQLLEILTKIETERGLLVLILGLVLIAIVIGIVNDAAEASRRKQVEEDQRQKLGVIRLSVDAARRHEVFTRFVLSAGDRYRIAVSGTYGFRDWGQWYKADVFYDHHGLPYAGLYIDGLPVQPTELDRVARIYAYSYVGIGRRLSVFLRPCKGINNDTACGRLTVDIVPEKIAQSLPQTSLSFAHQQQIECQRQAQEKADRERMAQRRAERGRRRMEAEQRREALERERQAEELKRYEQEARKQQEQEARQAELQEIATGLRIRAQLEQNWLNPSYRRNSAQHHTDEVLRHKQEFGQIYYQIHSNPELLALITAERAVLDWIKGWHQTILHAERIKALPEPAPEPIPVQPALPPRPEQRRLTEAEIRAKKEYVIKRDGRDKIAARIAKDDLLREYAEKLTEAHPDMDEDERQQRVNEFAQELMEDEDNDATKIQ